MDIMIQKMASGIHKVVSVHSHIDSMQQHAEPIVCLIWHM